MSLLFAATTADETDVIDVLSHYGFRLIHDTDRFTMYALQQEDRQILKSAGRGTETSVIILGTIKQNGALGENISDGASYAMVRVPSSGLSSKQIKQYSALVEAAERGDDKFFKLSSKANGADNFWYAFKSKAALERQIRALVFEHLNQVDLLFGVIIDEGKEGPEAPSPIPSRSRICAGSPGFLPRACWRLAASISAPFWWPRRG